MDKRKNLASYGIGGGIVRDSDIEEELKESQLKARILSYGMPDFKLIESILWTKANGYYLLDAHLQRLSHSAEYFSFEVDIKRVKMALSKYAVGLSKNAYKIRLLVGRSKQFTMEAGVLGKFEEKYTVAFAKTPVRASEDHYLYHKTSKREVYERALAENPLVSDVLVWNEDGEITKSCIANILVEFDGELVTPPISCGLSPGVYRKYLLDAGKIREASITLDEVRSSKAVYLINSVRKMWPVVLVP